ncbi:uncharacterized protein V6R79_000467 [Siganus canaliculatus]
MMARMRLCKRTRPSSLFVHHPESLQTKKKEEEEKRMSLVTKVGKGARCQNMLNSEVHLRSWLIPSFLTYSVQRCKFLVTILPCTVNTNINHNFSVVESCVQPPRYSAEWSVCRKRRIATSKSMALQNEPLRTDDDAPCDIWFLQQTEQYFKKRRKCCSAVYDIHWDIHGIFQTVPRTETIRSNNQQSIFQIQLALAKLLYIMPSICFVLKLRRMDSSSTNEHFDTTSALNSYKNIDLCCCKKPNM